MPSLLPDFASDLAQAVVSASTVPLLLLAGDQSILTASKSFCDEFDIQQTDMVGRVVYSLGNGEWNIPQFKSLLEGVCSGTISIPSYEMELMREGHSPKLLVINPQKLEYGDEKNARILLAVSDITNLRANEKLKDSLLAEKEILLREVQHRVANSLQIIASILLQSVRRVQSDEVRGHLQDAHSRILSLAAVQDQLSLSKNTDIDVQSYFTQLCKSLAASMIRDPKKLSITVQADQKNVSSDTATSLGLIITELVINCLKHAFPNNEGKIVVSFSSEGSRWVLAVRDNGIGMPKDPLKIKVGLGTSLIRALAQKLDAEIMIADRAPGTIVSITHAGGSKTSVGNRSF
jgi:two-component sensor histidine kinase